MPICVRAIEKSMSPRETYYLYSRLGIVIGFMLVVLMSLFYWPIHIADEHSPEWLVASFGRWILAIGGGPCRGPGCN